MTIRLQIVCRAAKYRDSHAFWGCFALLPSIFVLSGVKFLVRTFMCRKPASVFCCVAQYIWFAVLNDGWQGPIIIINRFPFICAHIRALRRPPSSGESF